MYRELMDEQQLARFVDSLAIPVERKEVVLAELSDHVASAREAALRLGRDPDAAARAAIGDFEALRRSLEAIEPAFHITRWRAIGHGVVASVLIGVVIDRGGVMYGVIGALLALAIAIAFAPRPRHALALLRGELRARRVRGAFVRGVPIGPMVTYVVTVMCVPFLVWNAMIVTRAALYGVTSFVVPWSAFVVGTASWVLLLVEGLRARRAKAAA